MVRTSALPASAATGAADPGPSRLGGRLTVILLAMLWPAQMLTVAGVFTSMAQAQVAQHFHTTQIAWFTLVYALAVTLVTPFVAKAGDLYGRKKVMLFVLSAGILGDLITALAQNYPTMLVGRGIAGLYGTMAALTYASARDLFPPRFVGMATGALGSAAGIVLVVCPLLGGWLLDAFGFHGVLWALVGGVALGLLLVLAFVPKIPPVPSGGGFDWLGGLLLGSAATALVYGIGQGDSWGWSDASLWALIAAALVLAAAFVLVELRTAHPLVDVRMLARRSVATVLVSTAIAQSAMFATGTIVVYVTLYPSIPGVSAGLGWSGTHSSLVGIPAGVVLLLVGLVAGVITRRIDPRLPWNAGLVLSALGLVALGFFHHDALELMLAGSLAYFGGGLVLACAGILMLGVVSHREQGLASGMFILLSNLMTAIVTQVMFAALNSGSRIAYGTRFYLDNGLRGGYIALAACMVFALLLSVFIPRVRPSDQVDAGEALSAA
ncbi:MFS transporter [Actinospica durhamensis]|uniref:MFS transporter n=1 Tax=Actinospica durhamensis TaxID=1508375 RepID=A0A941EX70_9ACTN|nr:MFS transporter [Actinospica durhamensis]MBR7835594.1 MFS transporter [Actinospica durhamensis]